MICYPNFNGRLGAIHISDMRPCFFVLSYLPPFTSHSPSSTIPPSLTLLLTSLTSPDKPGLIIDPCRMQPWSFEAPWIAFSVLYKIYMRNLPLYTNR